MKKVMKEEFKNLWQFFLHFLAVFNSHKSSTPVANEETDEGVTHRFKSTKSNSIPKNNIFQICDKERTTQNYARIKQEHFLIYEVENYILAKKHDIKRKLY